jgi:hypothetical protein
MKINGVQVTACEELLVLPRGGPGKDIPIRAKAVSIDEEFNKLVPLPTPPMLQSRDGNSPDYSDKNYKNALSARHDQRYAYMVILSIADNEIEWDTVDLEKPGTWLKWEGELMAGGISQVEINRISNAVMIANSLSEAKIKEAREAFLLGQDQ